MPFCDHGAFRMHYMHLSSSDVSPTEERQRQETGPALVFLHGLASNIGFWYPHIAPAFASLAPVVIPDLRGHGASGMPADGYDLDTMAGDVAALLRSLGIEQAILVGHSFGGAVAVATAISHPALVRALVLAEVRLQAAQPQLRLADWNPGPKWREALKDAGVTLDEQHPEGGMALLRVLAELVDRDPERARRLQHLFLGPGGGFGGKKAARRWLGLMNDTPAMAEITRIPPWGRDALSSLTLPILAMVGEHGVAGPTARRLAELCPSVRTVVIRGAGHFFPRSRPRMFVRHTLRFIKEIADYPSAG